MISMYLFLRKNRLLKKWRVYERLWLISFDITYAFYVLFLVGYILTAVILEGSTLHAIRGAQWQLRTIESNQIGFLITVLPLFYMFRTFSQPGITFSSTEYTITVLPYTRHQIWGMLALERWAKFAIIMGGIGAMYALFSLTPFMIVFGYISVLLMMNVFMTAIEWKVFQYPMWIKIALLLFLLGVNVMHFLFGSVYILLVVLGLLALFNILSYKTLLKQIDWRRVTAAADFKMWRMPLVSHATKTKFKKQRANTLWQWMSFWRKPFAYEKKTVYHRLWQLYFTKNMEYILRLTGVLMLMMAVLGWLQHWLFLLAIVITIHVLTNFMVVLFKDRFEVDIVQALPWHLEHFKQSFCMWIYPASLLFGMPPFVYFLFHPTPSNLLLFFLLGVLYVHLAEVKLARAMHQMDRSVQYRGWVEKVVYTCLILAVLTAPFPWMLWGMVPLLMVILFLRKRKMIMMTRYSP